MEAFSILALVGAVAAIAAAIMSFVRLFLKMQAQRKLAEALHRSRVAELLVRIEQTPDPNEKKNLHERLNRTVQEILDRWPPADKNRILEGFNRPSEESRIEYVEKVLSHAR